MKDGRGTVVSNDIVKSAWAGIMLHEGAAMTIKENRICFGLTGVEVYSSNSVLIDKNEIFENDGSGVDVHMDAKPKIIDNRIILNGEGITERTNTESEIKGTYFDRNFRGDYVSIDRLT